MQVHCVFLCNFVDSSVPCFAEIFAFEDVFGSGKGIDQFGFALIAHIAEHDISLCLQRHQPPTSIGFAIRQLDRLPQVFLDDICCETVGAEERSIHRRNLFRIHICMPVWLAWRNGLCIVDSIIIAENNVSDNNRIQKDNGYHGRK